MEKMKSFTSKKFTKDSGRGLVARAPEEIRKAWENGEEVSGEWVRIEENDTPFASGSRAIMLDMRINSNPHMVIFNFELGETRITRALELENQLIDKGVVYDSGTGVEARTGCSVENITLLCPTEAEKNFVKDYLAKHGYTVKEIEVTE